MEEPSAESHVPAAEPSVIRDYAQLRSRLSYCIDRLASVDQAPLQALGELKSKIEHNRFHLVVVGQFKRGKTCLINALIGADILPVAVVPLTSIVTILTYGETVRMEVHFLDGRIEAIDPAVLPDYVTEAGNPQNERCVKEVLIHYPSPYLRDGVRLIDTPGVGSVYLHNTDAAYEYLPKCDAALFLLSVEQPASKAELDFLKDVREYSGKIFFLLNKIDYLSDSEVTESLAFSRQVLREAMETEVRVFPISAKLALQGKLDESEEALKRSRLPAFSGVLDEFLVHEKGRVLLLAASGQLLRVASQGQLAMELELKSLSEPIDELRHKIELIEAKGREIARERDRIGQLMDGEIERLLREELDPEINRFTRELRERMGGELKRLFDAHQEMLPKELDALLESFLVCEVENAYRGWRLSLEKRLGSSFQEQCRALAVKTNDIIEVLMKYASGLFEVVFEPLSTSGFWLEDSKFQFRLREDPVGLDMLADSISGALPGLIAKRFERLRFFLFQRARTYFYKRRFSQMEHLVGMQAGRIRYDLVERLKKSGAGFRMEMQERIETAVASIAQAVHRGIDRREEGERAAERRRRELSTGLMELEAVREELLKIRQEAYLH